MKQPVNLIEYHCDSCGTVVYSDQEGNPVRGYYGTANYVETTGSIGADWYACRRACVRAAVLGCLDENYGSDERKEATREANALTSGGRG